MKIEIKNRYTKEIIFSGNADNLTDANLTDADCRGADFFRADLRNVNLSCSDCRGADFQWSDCRGADFRGADLTDADFRGADLRCAVGNMKEIKSFQLDKWMVTFTNDVMAIGFWQHEIEKWRCFDDEKINNMNSCELEWWQKWKDFIFTAIDLSFQ